MNPFADSNQYSSTAYGGSGGSGKTAKEIELERREAALRAKEIEVLKVPCSNNTQASPYIHAHPPFIEKLADREKNAGSYKAPNFPKCRPVVYHDIEADIPEGGKWLVKRLYFCWWLAMTTYLVNLAACLALLIVKADSAGGNFGLSLVYFLVGTPVSWNFWYQAIYNGVKHDRSVSFFLFFFNYGFHIAFSGLLAVGIPGWGGAGIIYTIATIGSDVGCGIVCGIASGLLCFEVVYGLWSVKNASVYYRSKGMSVDAAKREAAQGVASSGIGRELAAGAVKSQFTGGV